MIFKNISPGIKLYNDSHGEIKAKYKVEQTFQAYFIGKKIESIIGGKTKSNIEFQIYSDPDNINYIGELPFTLNLDYNEFDDNGNPISDGLKKPIIKTLKFFVEYLVFYHEKKDIYLNLRKWVSRLELFNNNDTINDRFLSNSSEIVIKEFLEKNIDSFSENDLLLEKLNNSIDAHKIFNYQGWIPVIDSNFKFDVYLHVGLNLVTGKAGVGKSFLINRLSNLLPNNSIVKLSPTAIAAININGQTIHSFFRLPPYLFDPSDNSYVTKDAKFSSIDVLVIDEISMVPGYIIDAIDRILRENNDSHSIFGGVIILAFGDLLQLPPIPSQDKDAKEFIDHNYNGSYWFFDAKTFDDDPPLNNIFTTIFPAIISYSKRHKNSSFIHFLDMFRKGDVDDPELFNEIASKICNNLQKKETTHLVTTNEKAKSINFSELEKIDADNFLFEARTTGNWGDSSYPNDNQINLKIGAEIIFIKNDTDKDYYNGEKGIVESLNNNNVIIKKNKSDTIIVEFATWEKIKYVYNSETNKLETEVIGTFSQLPLKLGWAITIHRSQGMTLDHVSIDLNMNFFAKSLIYVALSRVREFSDIYISNGNFNLDLFSLPDQRVIRFMKTFGFLNA